MRQLFALSLILTIACARGRSAAPAAATQQVAEMKTIETVDPRPTVIDPPPVLQDEAPPPQPKQMPWEPPQVVVMTPEDEKVRAALPFSPAIAMDPVNGDKISIRATTPTFEYKGRIFYFTNEENRRTFIANPDQFTKAGFTKL
jgi:YHS domain-containing protein